MVRKDTPTDCDRSVTRPSDGSSRLALEEPGPLLHQLFESQANRRPDSTALICGRQRMSYAELNSLSNQLARYLQEKGVGPDVLVALFLDRGIEMVIAILGVLKAGGAYVPLDPMYPADRLTFMIEDAGPRIILSQANLRAALPSTAHELIEIDSRWNEIATRDAKDIANSAHGTTDVNLAYVIYTSGSTGRPKAAMNNHRGMVNRITNQHEVEAFGAGDVCCHRTSLSFVDAVYELFGPLCSGVPLVIVTAEVVRNVAKLAALIAQEHVTRLLTVPSLARSMLESSQIMRDLAGLRGWTLSGEEVQADLLKSLQQRLPTCEFILQYGSSEVSSDAALYKSRGFEGSRVPLGHAVANTRVYILDGHGQPVPAGDIGEICVSGMNVGRGYLNRPDLTADRFIADPFAAYPGARLYRSGDLGRWSAEGLLEYCGRRDHQVKIRGFRIEVAEIEAQLRRQHCVRDAVVVAKEDHAGEKRLVAYVLSRDKAGNCGPAASRAMFSVQGLRDVLKQALPEYMVPSAIVLMEEWPLTPNGKLDRKALPAPGPAAFVTKEYEAPQGDREQALASVWQEVLGTPRVGRQDNFFELGGHSLLIVKIIERLRHLNLAVEARDVYVSATLADLARCVVYETAEQESIPPNSIPQGCNAITPEMLSLVSLDTRQIERIAAEVPGGMSNIQDIYPLTPLQEGMLFHHLLDGEADAYVAATTLEVPTRDRLNELIVALRCVIDRHDALRTAVLWDDLPRPVQVVYRHAELPVDEIELPRGVDLQAQIREWARPERLMIDLQRAPLVRLSLAKDIGRDCWYAVLQMHHLVDDDRSLKSFIAEIAALLQGKGDELPDPVAYRDHVATVLRRHDEAAIAQFFRSKLAGIEDMTAPFGLMDRHVDPHRVVKAHIRLERDLSLRIRVQALQRGVSVATLFHAAWGLVIAQTSSRDDVVFGSVLLGRMQGSSDAQQAIGMFINTLPLRLRLHQVTAQGLIEQTHRELADLLSYEHAPLALAQRCSEISGSGPLFSALLNFRHGSLDPEAEWGRAIGIKVISHEYRMSYPVGLAVDDLGEAFSLGAQAVRPVSPEKIIAYTTEALRSLVTALESRSQVSALDLSVLPKEERARVIKSFNETRATFAESRAIHELFEEQVRREPDATAVIDGDTFLTYSELNSRGDQLAHFLRQRGVGPDQLIGLCIGRRVELLVGLIGILKAGGAYLPLDPSNPIERLNHLLTDASPQLLLTTAELRASLSPAGAEVIALDEDWETIATRSSEQPIARLPPLSSDNLAYIIYTSGSTGKPKGVMISHRNIVNYSLHALRQFDVSSGDGTLICTSISFDLMLTGLYPTLLAGKPVRLCPEEAGLPDLANQLLRSRDLAPLKLTPSHMGLLEPALRDGKLDGRVRVLVLGGEQLHENVVKLWREHAPSTRIFNHYGPTETTVGAVVKEIGSHIEGAIPIGCPISNASVYVLNSHLEPVPIGVHGEIYIGGAGVGRGYSNRPGLTAERFLCDPFSLEPGARMYRTGDLGRWREEGDIEYLGRNDSQVKIRGYRIELAEVEAQLKLQKYLRDAVVTVREDVSGDRRLVAYVTQCEGSQLTVEEIRDSIKNALPDYMVPSVFVILKTLPLTPNGKVDRRALPVPTIEAQRSRCYEAPEGDMECALANIWQEVLHVERVGRNDSFFELGGHSLLAMQVIVRLRALLSLDMPVRSLFDFPMLRELADRADHLSYCRLIEELESAQDVDELLDQVAAMSAGQVEELARELTEGVGP